ncbi:uncharacterized protein NESG_00703 [Nematocida ausubeli]|uniref:DNA 5'-3' helicase n=1 Tax=Nematocida ausubeli (strain ATCC PRA-371 / ERTm2) TaxID=1913371 RepID=A0A086J334_NEMA1|nr:uncharacterized protein NESG_00703 [Nematocida ausubeli]KFG26552.1 hypothetical protein NESG_00703 [Nematocida ausubeli]
MHSETIKNYTINTEYELYEPQRKSIETILTCLDNGESGMIESPTGTGKTLSILEAVVAWVNKNPEKLEGGQIYVTTRTIKQASQLIAHLKKMKNAPIMNLLASRRHLCLNSEVSKSNDIDSACKKKNKDPNKEGRCKYYRTPNEKEQERDRNISLPGVFSIEDLVSAGGECNSCPFYYTRERQEKATIIFSPYNYIVSERISTALKIDLTGSVLIVDEAHNIDDVCRSTGSVDIKRADLVSLISRLGTGSGMESPEVANSMMETGKFVKKIMNYLEETTDVLNKLDPGQCVINSDNQREMSIPSKEMISTLEKMGISKLTIDDTFSSIELLFKDMIPDDYFFQWITQIKDVLKYIMNNGENKYGMVVSSDKISFLLLHAAAIFDPIYEKARSVILLSGTLEPFQELVTELTTKKNSFKHFLSADHIISQSQLYTAEVSQYNSVPILGTYQGSKHPDYISTLVSSIVDIAHSLEKVGGVLCFVPSYNMLTLLERKLEKHVKLFVENKNNSKFEYELEQYRRYCKMGKCIFLCVFRGKASEGINFRDHESRAVILVGIPYPNIRNHSVILKKQYNDRYLSSTGSKWYEQQAFRAVNQALGRCIRHKNDWGSIFMLDSRYRSAVRSLKISKWAIASVNMIMDKTKLKDTFAPFVLNQKKTPNEEEFVKENTSYPVKRQYPSYSSGNFKRFFQS